MNCGGLGLTYEQEKTLVIVQASCAVVSNVAVVSFAVEIGLGEKEDWREKVTGRVNAIEADAFAGANAAGLGTTAVRLFQGAAGADPFTPISVAASGFSAEPTSTHPPSPPPSPPP